MTVHPKAGTQAGAGEELPWLTLDEFDIPSQPGMERQASERVAAAIREVDLPADQVDRLKTAVAEATMNAMEHGNHYNAETPVRLLVRVSSERLLVSITDLGGGEIHSDADQPDLEAKLAGLQSPRGWGLFLIKRMVDEMRVIENDQQHTVELILNLKGGTHG
jgi:anti-sigma regulatory factor (Ser/Thr protein kinase)